MRTLNILLIALCAWPLFGPAFAGAQTPEFKRCHAVPSGWNVVPGFAVPWNPFTPEKELLLSSYCEGDRGLARVGGAGAYVYKTGYSWTGALWKPFAFSGTSVAYQTWFSGYADWLMSPTPVGETLYWIAYVCQLRTATSATGVSSRSWKCGCRDAVCARPYWQLQGFIRLTAANAVGV